MSLIVAVYVPEGIVMASDSRQSITIGGTRPTGEEFKVETVNSDAVMKTFLLDQQQVGISNFGQDLLNGVPMASYIRRFIDEALVAAEADSLEQSLVGNKPQHKLPFARKELDEVYEMFSGEGKEEEDLWKES